MACRRASTGGKPARRFSAACRAICSSISSRNRSSCVRLVAKLTSRVKKRLKDFMKNPPLSLRRTERRDSVAVQQSQDIESLEDHQRQRALENVRFLLHSFND